MLVAMLLRVLMQCRSSPRLQARGWLEVEWARIKGPHYDGPQMDILGPGRLRVDEGGGTAAVRKRVWRPGDEEARTSLRAEVERTEKQWREGMDSNGELVRQDVMQQMAWLRQLEEVGSQAELTRQDLI